MPIFEIALPNLKRDAALIQEAEEKIVPAMRPLLHNAGILNGLRGFFTSEDGRDIRDEFREALVLGAYFISLYTTTPFLSFPFFFCFLSLSLSLYIYMCVCENPTDQNTTEWPSAEHFQTFISSAPFLSVMGAVKEKYADGPPVLKLFDYAHHDDHSTKLASIFGQDTVLEYLVIRPKDDTEAGVEHVMKKLQQSRLASELGTQRVAVGKSSNVQTVEIAVLAAWENETVSLTLFVLLFIYHHLRIQRVNANNM